MRTLLIISLVVGLAGLVVACGSEASGGEDVLSCDAGCAPGADGGCVCTPECTCGNGVCSPSCGENSCLCPGDCEPTCGDGCCDINQGETELDCPEDCECSVPDAVRIVDLACGFCGMVQHRCRDDGQWEYDSCAQQGECPPGAVMIGGECGMCGMGRNTCSDQCTWQLKDCLMERDCEPGTTKTEGECGNCGAQQWGCTGECRWEKESCAGEGICTPGTVNASEDSCGFCGRWDYRCTDSCEWVYDLCEEQGECEPGNTSPCGECGGHRECQDDCYWEPGCRGEKTFAVMYPLGAPGVEDDAEGIYAGLEELYGEQCGALYEVSGEDSLDEVQQIAKSHTVSVMTGNQCNWSPTAFKSGCDGEPQACGLAQVQIDDIWGELLDDSCGMESVDCLDVWLVQKGAETVACSGGQDNCLYAVSGYDDEALGNAADAYVTMAAEYQESPCSAPSLTPTCAEKCPGKCGELGGCDCGPCPGCDQCTDDNSCQPHPDVGKSCSDKGGCYECLDGEVDCAGEYCDLWIETCQVIKWAGCGILSKVVLCTASGVVCASFSGPGAVICVAACTVVVANMCKLLTELGLDAAGANCWDLGNMAGWCPEEPCDEN